MTLLFELCRLLPCAHKVVAHGGVSGCLDVVSPPLALALTVRRRRFRGGKDVSTRGLGSFSRFIILFAVYLSAITMGSSVVAFPARAPALLRLPS